MRTVKVQEAKTHLSALLASVERGEQVTIARGSRPIARLAPIEDPPARELGFVTIPIPEDFDEPLPDSEISAWEG